MYKYKVLIILFTIFFPVYGYSATVNILQMQPVPIQDLWDDVERKNITYCIDARGPDMSWNNTGFTAMEYLFVAQAIESAALEWETYADVDFIHRSSEDYNCHDANLNVVFNVRPERTWGDRAAAFFPSYPRAKRQLRIGANLIDINNLHFNYFSLYGAMRHELGHILGLRHEHIRNDISFPEMEGKLKENCLKELNEAPYYFALTPPDFHSVMAYPPCVNREWFDLFLSAWDIQAIEQMYPRNTCAGSCHSQQSQSMKIKAGFPFLDPEYRTRIPFKEGNKGLTKNYINIEI